MPDTLTPDTAQMSAVLAASRRAVRNNAVATALGVSVIAIAFTYAGVFDLARYKGALTTILTLAGDATPPDFSRWPKWGKPLLDTLAMSVAGTVLGALAALVLGSLAARNLTPHWVGQPVLLLLNGLRSVPGLIWGVLYVAAVGFGPLPGIFALATHSTGMLGKFYAEIFEHVDRAPGDALRSHGVSPLGVLRYSVWPQVLPRLLDVTIYRWEHNVRAATTLGVIGVGGLGLEIITAFHLFEYREAAALVLVLLVMVTMINAFSGWLRYRLIRRV